MSLVITTYVPEGIVMASDSRQSINIKGKTPQGKDFKIETVNSDTVIKTFILEKQKVGISSFGKNLLGGVPMASHIKRFSEEILNDEDDVKSVAKKILRFMLNEFKKVDTGFHVCGYKKENKISIPYVFICHVGRNEIIRKNIKKDGSLTYGATWSGQGDIISGLINPVVITSPYGKKKVIKPAAPIIWDAMPLQDANKSNISQVLAAGISQYKLVDIHPFLDGNGRTARVLCTLILYQNGYDFKKLFSLSEYYDKDRAGYYEAIQAVRENEMYMTYWLEYFTEGFRQCSKPACPAMWGFSG